MESYASRIPGQTNNTPPILPVTPHPPLTHTHDETPRPRSEHSSAGTQNQWGNQLRNSFRRLCGKKRSTRLGCIQELSLGESIGIRLGVAVGGRCCHTVGCERGSGCTAGG